MKHPSAYLNWYVNVHDLRFDLRSSGIAHFKFNFTLGEVDLSTNYAHGNPKTAKLLAQRYSVRPENVFISSEGATGQNTRIIRYLAEKNEQKNEAVVEYPTYEPLLRLVQEFYPHVKRLERKEKDEYKLDADALKKVVSDKTALLVLTNPHAPSGSIADRIELQEIMSVAREYGFFVVCDEVYAEFDRKTMPTIFSVDPELGITTTSFTKAYGLGGLKLGIALTNKELVDELYIDVLNTVGNSPNIVQLVAAELLANGKEKLEQHKRKWIRIKKETEQWLKEKNFQYFPSKAGVTYWIKLPTKDTYKWTNNHAIPKYSLALVPGAFFLYKNNYELTKSNMARIGLGAINPDQSNMTEVLETLEKAIDTYEEH